MISKFRNTYNVIAKVNHFQHNALQNIKNHGISYSVYFERLSSNFKYFKTLNMISMKMISSANDKIKHNEIITDEKRLKDVKIEYDENQILTNDSALHILAANFQYGLSLYKSIYI